MPAVRRAFLLVAALGLLVAAPAAARERARFPVAVQPGIVYGAGQVGRPAPARVDLRLDLYRPVMRSRRTRPAVVLIHGGGFSGGSRLQPDLGRVARGLAARGIVVANVDYRLSGQQPVPSSRAARVATAVPLAVPIFRGIVAAIDDTLTAVSWLRRHARRLRIDRRLGLVGASAGGFTANHVAYALDDLGIDGPRVRFVGDLWGGIALPIGAAAVERREARLFAVHGTADRIVGVGLGDALVARARAAGLPVEYHRVEGGGNGFAGSGFFTREGAPGRTAFDRLRAFAERALRR
jgi:acetyl esterase/lipase